MSNSSIRILAASLAPFALAASALQGPAGHAAVTAPATAAPAAASVAAAAGPGRNFSVSNSAQLRRAVAAANRRSGKDTIVLRSNVRLFGGALRITDNLVVDGNGRTIDARNKSRIFTVAKGDRLALNNVKLRNGRVKGSGGAVAVQGSLVVRFSQITNSKARGEGGSGGAIFNDGGKVKVVATRFQGNSAVRAGGAIEALAGRTLVQRSDFRRNRTGAEPGNGGAFHLTGDGRVEIEDSRVIANSAASEGGGLWNSADGTMIVSETIVERNKARGDDADNGGGGVFNDGGRMLLRDVKVRENKATGESGSGGGVLNDGGRLRLFDTLVFKNTANRAGGGIEADGGNTNIEGSRLALNNTGANPGNGGALHLTGVGRVKIAKSKVRKNTASAEGGGLWNSAGGSFVVANVKLVGNVAQGNDADQGGGGIFNDGGQLSVQFARFAKNRATGTSGSGGGLLSVAEGTNNVGDSLFIRNTAKRAGGGIELNTGGLEMDSTNFVRNSTGANPGNGGAIHTTESTTVDFTEGIIRGNNGANEGGGFWFFGAGDFRADLITFDGNTSPTGPDVFNNGDGVGVMIVNNEPILPS